MPVFYSFFYVISLETLETKVCGSLCTFGVTPCSETSGTVPCTLDAITPGKLHWWPIHAHPSSIQTLKHSLSLTKIRILMWRNNDFSTAELFKLTQEPITRSVQLPYCVCETAFSQVNLFLDKLFPRIGWLSTKLRQLVYAGNKHNGYQWPVRNLYQRFLTVF